LEEALEGHAIKDLKEFGLSDQNVYVYKQLLRPQIPKVQKYRQVVSVF